MEVTAVELMLNACMGEKRGQRVNSEHFVFRGQAVKSMLYYYSDKANLNDQRPEDLEKQCYEMTICYSSQEEETCLTKELQEEAS